MLVVFMTYVVKIDASCTALTYESEAVESQPYNPLPLHIKRVITKSITSLLYPTEHPCPLHLVISSVSSYFILSNLTSVNLDNRTWSTDTKVHLDNIICVTS
jgi:hypothetical protein